MLREKKRSTDREYIVNKSGGVSAGPSMDLSHTCLFPLSPFQFQSCLIDYGRIWSSLQNLNTLTPTSPTIHHNVESKFTIRHSPLQINHSISIQCPFLLYPRLYDSTFLPHQQRRRLLHPRPTPTIQNQQIRHLRALQQRRPKTCRR